MSTDMLSVMDGWKSCESSGAFLYDDDDDDDAAADA